MFEFVQSNHVLVSVFIPAAFVILLMVGFLGLCCPRRRGRLHATPIHTTPKYFLTTTSHESSKTRTILMGDTATEEPCGMTRP